jgi:hypothetical protein
MPATNSIEARDDQFVRIHVPGFPADETGRLRYFEALGDPALIHQLLLAGAEVIIQIRREIGLPSESVLRLSPGTPFVLTYPEAVTS